MQQLGYSRYVAQGGDWGAFVTTAMAQQRAPGLEAVHLNFAQTIPDRIPARLLPDQKKAVAVSRKWKECAAYAMLQQFKPQLAGYALAELASSAGGLALRHLRQRQRWHRPSRERAAD